MNATQLLNDYECDGVVRVSHFLSADEVVSVRAELDRYIRDDLASKPPNARTLEKDEKTVRNLLRHEEHNDYFRALGEREDIKALIAPLVPNSSSSRASPPAPTSWPPTPRATHRINSGPSRPT